MSWFEPSFVYQVYPLGLCGAPHENDGVLEHRLLRLIDDGWVDHMAKMGATCLLLNPVFESDAHGYDTRDYTKVDCRLGTNDDLRAVVDACHATGIKVLLDGVFNHVGRGFWAFQDVLAHRGESPYAGWFEIDFNGNNCFNDGLSYSCWEGAVNLVKLNHWNGELNDYLADVIRGWVREFDIDGLRLDVAYCLDQGFLRFLRALANQIGEERGQKFPLVGETMFGDYNQWMGEDLCDSVTNYEAYKGLWSSMNSANMHEIAYALERQSGSHPWDLYTGRHMLDFVDNHDVPRIATKLGDKNQLVPLYGLLFAMSRRSGGLLRQRVGHRGRAAPWRPRAAPSARRARSGTSLQTGSPPSPRRARAQRRWCGATTRSSSASRSSWSFQRRSDKRARDCGHQRGGLAGCRALRRAVRSRRGPHHRRGARLPAAAPSSCPYSARYWRCER